MDVDVVFDEVEMWVGFELFDGVGVDVYVVDFVVIVV